MSQAPVHGGFAGTLGAFRLDAEFALPSRGITALTGPSGSGKTTLLRCIAGLTRLPGRLTVDGDVWQDARTFLPTHRRAIGFVFQDASLLPHLSMKGNLTYGARRVPDRTVKFADVVELLGLPALLVRSTGALSGGERQRVALGRALLSQPRLLLMDEPLSSLDADSKAEIMPYLERLHRELSLPTLYVTHDAREIARLADHVLLMRAGRVAALQPARANLDAAREALAAISPEKREGLALAALMAGLPPV